MAQQLWKEAEHPPATRAPAAMTLSVVIPALNEGQGILDIVEKVLATKDKLLRVGVQRMEVIVVDDGSNDGTAEKVQGIWGVRVVRHGVNRGYGAALKTGFRESTGDLLAFLDADSTYPPEYLVELCELVASGKADLAIGSRRSGVASSMPPIRRLGNLIWSSLLTLIGGEKVRDPASGMRVFRRDCLRELYPLPDGLNFTPVMSTRALHEGLKIIEAPIEYHERAGRSKLSIFRDGFRFLGTIIWTALQYNPGRILELGGFFALALVGLLGAALVAARLSGVTELGAWGVLSVYVGLVFAVGGVGAFSLGVTFNRLVALFHARPMRQPGFLIRLKGASPERLFRRLGGMLLVSGIVLGAVSVTFGLQGWDLDRLWLWLLGSALFVLVGFQLSLFWMLVRVLDILVKREDVIDAEFKRQAQNAS